MKIKSFRYVGKETRSLGSSAPLFAEVVVETGLLWWKKIETKKVCREIGNPFWYWVDTGKWCPNHMVEEAEKRHKSFVLLEKINEKTD